MKTLLNPQTKLLNGYFNESSYYYWLLKWVPILIIDLIHVDKLEIEKIETVLGNKKKTCLLYFFILKIKKKSF
jgi:hypothetical protein